MCDAGRIKHHLKHNLWRSDSTILFVGYQAEGTLGRRIIDGAAKVKIFGEEISVNARIEVIDGFSGHADKAGLLSWIGKISKKPKKVFIVHGENETMPLFAQTITQEYGIQCIVPSRGDSYVVSNEKVYENIPTAEVRNKFRRLAVVDMLETLREEFDELASILKGDLKQGKTDVEIDEVTAKLKMIQKAFVDALK